MNEANKSTATAIPAAHTIHPWRLKNPLFAVDAILPLDNVTPRT
jgi:hypothetical protein